MRDGQLKPGVVGFLLSLLPLASHGQAPTESVRLGLVHTLTPSANRRRLFDTVSRTFESLSDFRHYDPEFEGPLYVLVSHVHALSRPRHFVVFRAFLSCAFKAASCATSVKKTHKKRVN